jgi:hypothetical protein
VFMVTSAVIIGLALALTTGSEAVLVQGHYVFSDLCTRTCHRIPVTGFNFVSWSPSGGFPLTGTRRGPVAWRRLPGAKVRCTRAILFACVGLMVIRPPSWRSPPLAPVGVLWLLCSLTDVCTIWLIVRVAAHAALMGRGGSACEGSLLQCFLSLALACSCLILGT